MNNNCSRSSRCAHCGTKLPRGVRVALFATPDSEEAVLGDFCSVTHAMSALEEIAGGDELPDSLFLGVRVDRDDHDERALAMVMTDVVRRAVRKAVASDEGERPSIPASQLN